MMTGIHAPIPNLPPGTLGTIALFAASPAGITPKKTSKRRFQAFLVNPNGMTQQEWMDAFVLAMSPTLPLPQTGADFTLWSAQILQEPQLSAFQVPPGDDWQAFAVQLNSSLGLF